MRTVVIGAPGQLGRDLCPRLPGPVIPLERKDLDLADSARVLDVLRGHAPTMVVNCAAYNLVDKAEDDPASAFATNAFGVRALATACAELDALLVHFSTDYVFGLEADRPGPLLETDAPGPVSVYGASKLAGEYFARTYAPKHLVIRTCGLYGVWGSGGKGGNFVETMLRGARGGKPLRVVSDQRCTPTYTPDLADATVGLIRANARGLFHATSGGDCSWYEFAREIFRQSGVEAELTPISTGEFGARARRPAYSVLSGKKLAAAIGRPMRPWAEALSDYLRERTSRPNLQ